MLTDLRARFDLILAELESVAGWRTARVNRPVLILRSLDGIETGIRQLIRDEPLETREINFAGQHLRLPTEAEMLRIKAVLVLKRNATRDYVDLVALTDHLGMQSAIEGLRPFDQVGCLPVESAVAMVRNFHHEVHGAHEDLPGARSSFPCRGRTGLVPTHFYKPLRASSRVRAGSPGSCWRRWRGPTGRRRGFLRARGGGCCRGSA